MSTETRIRDLQEWMSRVRSKQEVGDLPELGKWLDELGQIREEVALASTSFRDFADVNEAMRLLIRLLEAAHTSHISAEQVRSMVDLLHFRTDTTLEQMRPLYL